MRSVDAEIVITDAAELGVSISETQVSLLLRHLDEVLLANRRLNLTAVTNRSAALSRHIVDSLALVPYLRHQTGPIVDIGSGAGFPGIPLAVAEEGPVDLLEPTKKKAQFLLSCVAQLGGLNGSRVLAERAEDLARSRPETYSIACARAVTSLSSLVELAAPLLRANGVLYAMKGTPERDERERGRLVGELVGLEEAGWDEYVLPRTGERRTVARYQKTGSSRVELPRRTGMAQKRPLG